jgi:hypothetical protein
MDFRRFGVSGVLALLVAGCAETAPVDDEGGEVTADAQQALNAGDSFDVDFEDCIESIGVGLVPTTNARALTPAQYILVGEADPVTPIVVRTSHCEEIRVNGQGSKEGSIVQIGAVIVPPDFTGDINNYTFWYYTDHKKLAKKLQDAGVAAKYVPDLEYDYDPGCSGHPAELKVKVPAGYGAPRLKLKGTVVESQMPAGSFDANWWRESQVAGVKMATNVPIIDIGSANLQLTNANGALAQLIGGDTLGFPILQQFNTFDDAEMNVTTP